MKHGLFVVIVLLLSAVFANTAQAVDTHDNNSTGAKERLVKRLDRAWEKDRARGLKALLDTGEVDDFTERKILAGWAHDHYISTIDRNPRVGLIYAGSLAEMASEYLQTRNETEYYKNMRNGLGVFISSQMIAYEDIARCADKSVGSSYAAMWRTGATYKSYKKFLASESEKNRVAAWQAAKNLSDTRELKRADREVCASGADAIARAQLKGKCVAGEACDASEYVELLSNSQWMPLRAQVQGMIEKRVLEGNI